MAASVREDLLSAGLAVFDREGFEGATIAAIRKQARASNGSFFHVFASKKDLAGALFLDVLGRSEEHTSELQSHLNLVCRLLLEKKKKKKITSLLDQIKKK